MTYNDIRRSGTPTAQNNIVLRVGQSRPVIDRFGIEYVTPERRGHGDNRIDCINKIKRQIGRLKLTLRKNR